VAIGSVFGLLIGNRLPERIHQTIIVGIGLVTFFVGIDNVSKTGNIIIPLISITVGGIIGELLRLDLALERFGGWLQTRFARSSAPEGSEAAADQRARFINAFITSSLLFCVGPLTFVGSIMNGMGIALGFQQLAIKSVLDLFSSMAFAASLGVGVAFSIVTVLVIQGGLALIGSLIVGSADPVTLSRNPLILETTAVGGVMLIGLALILLDIKRPRIANFLPALLVAPLLVAAGTALGINLYPL
jgi:uncharacterized membrane protein YqgA involved in biofilm formation